MEKLSHLIHLKYLPLDFVMWGHVKIVKYASVLHFLNNHKARITNVVLSVTEEQQQIKVFTKFEI